MARPLRVEFPGALYLVTARAAARQKLFRDVAEQADFSGRFPDLVAAFGCRFHGYSLLRNHYHLLVETPEGNLSRVLHRLNAGYTAGVNARRRRKGPLLQSRYRCILLEEDPWLLRLSVHVHLNPVRRRLVQNPWNYPGSSAGAFQPGGAPIPGVYTERVLALAGGRRAYAALLDEALRAPPPPPWNQVWRQIVLGGAALRERVAAAAAGRDLREVPGFSAAPDRPDLAAILHVVARHTGVAPEEIVRGKFQRVLARKLAMHLARRYTGLTLREIGEAFAVDYTTVHMAVRRLEELRRRDPGVEEFVGELERELEPEPGPGFEAGVAEPPARPRGKRKGKGKGAKTGRPQLELF